jgi:predicted nucleic acid-binding Zn ribbon protein
MRFQFGCLNCLNIFDLEMTSVQFNPEPECPECGATEEIVLSDFGLQQIDLMILHNRIPTIK